MLNHYFARQADQLGSRASETSEIQTDTTRRPRLTSPLAKASIHSVPHFVHKPFNSLFPSACLEQRKKRVSLLIKFFASGCGRRDEGRSGRDLNILALL